MLTLDSEPVNQDTGKQKIFTTLAIRLVWTSPPRPRRRWTCWTATICLQRRGETTTSVTDAAGDARVIEYDPEQEGRPLRWTAMQAITNFTAAMPI